MPPQHTEGLLGHCFCARLLYAFCCFALPMLFHDATECEPQQNTADVKQQHCRAAKQCSSYSST
eukprot:15478690-Alexandrium_andersonii.AAC.1